MPVNLKSDEVTVTSFSTKDVAIVGAFKMAADMGKEPEDTLLSLLGLGAQVAALGSHSAGAEKIEASVGHAKDSIKGITEAFQETIKREVNDFTSEDGSFVKSLETVMNTFRAQVEEMTAGEDSPLREAMFKSLGEVQQQIRDDVSLQIGAHRRDIASLLDPADPTSPLRMLSEKLDGIQAAVTDVQQGIAISTAVAKVVEPGVAGGFNYEDAAVDAIQKLSSFAGDDCEHCGNITGFVANSKKGDACVDLKVGARIHARMVVEAKNRSLSKLDWEREAEGSMSNRGATGFIGMCKHFDDMPNKSRLLVLGSQSVVIAFDPEIDDFQMLSLVYQLVKLNTLSTTGHLDEVNIAEVNKSLEEAAKALDKLNAISKSATVIRNAADTMIRDIESLRGAVSQHLESAQAAISKGLSLDIMLAVEQNSKEDAEPPEALGEATD
jgi:hypothetical protein